MNKLLIKEEDLKMVLLYKSPGYMRLDDIRELYSSIVSTGMLVSVNEVEKKFQTPPRPHENSKAGSWIY